MESMRNTSRSCNKLFALLIVPCCYLAGCASSVTVRSDFPTPLIEPLPVRVGLIFSEELRDFQHHEELPQQANWTIDLGDINITMLQPLFESMFVETQNVEAIPVDMPENNALDGILKASLNRFEFDVPVNSDNKFTEVWMQYQLDLYEPGGELITEWQVSGYGKAEIGRTKRTESVSRAAINAMREVGATISTRFAQQPRIGFWLKERQDADSINE